MQINTQHTNLDHPYKNKQRLQKNLLGSLIQSTHQPYQGLRFHFKPLIKLQNILWRHTTLHILPQLTRHVLKYLTSPWELLGSRWFILSLEQCLLDLVLDIFFYILHVLLLFFSSFSHSYLLLLFGFFWLLWLFWLGFLLLLGSSFLFGFFVLLFLGLEFLDYESVFQDFRLEFFEFFEGGFVLGVFED